jgi:hypothetical protein
MVAGGWQCRELCNEAQQLRLQTHSISCPLIGTGRGRGANLVTLGHFGSTPKLGCCVLSTVGGWRKHKGRDAVTGQSAMPVTVSRCLEALNVPTALCPEFLGTNLVYGYIVNAGPKLPSIRRTSSVPNIKHSFQEVGSYGVCASTMTCRFYLPVRSICTVSETWYDALSV